MREITENKVFFLFCGTQCISDIKMRSYARLRGEHNENLGNKCVTVVSDSRPQLLELSSVGFSISDGFIFVDQLFIKRGEVAALDHE